MTIRRRTLLQHSGGAAALVLAGGTAVAQKVATPPIAIAPPLPPRLVVSGAALPIQLRHVRVSAEIVGRMALTTVEFGFFNPNNRVLEGELQFPLLDGQTVVGMAMELDGAMREAVAVEKARGEQVFEDVTRARIDPALLSATQGNNHKLRVYPLLPQAGKRVQIRYAEALTTSGGRLAYRLPLDFGERLAELAITLRVAGSGTAPQARATAVDPPAFAASAGGHALDWTQRDVLPRGQLAVDLAADPAGSIATGTRDGRRFFVAQVPLPAERAPRMLPKSVGIVWDASGSGAERDHGREFALLDAYFARAADVDVRLVCIRDVAEPVRRFRVAGGDWSVLRHELEATVYDGATALGAIPAELGGGEWLVFSDGLSNYGTRAFAAPKLPVYAVSAALRADAQRLRAIAEASGGAFVDLTALNTTEAAARLLEQPLRLVRLESNGAKRLVAASTRAEDGWLTVAGELTEAETTVRLQLESATGRRQVQVLRIERVADALLAPQAWARLAIAALEADAEANRGEIRRLSQGFGIVTRETSLIVLDRAEDYARHEIAPPPELADAVAVLRARGVQLQRESTQAQLERVVRLFERKVAWWQSSFPKGDRRPEPPNKQPEMNLLGQADERRRERRSADSTMPATPMAAAPALSAAAPMRELAAKAAGAAGPAGAMAGATIRLRLAQPDSPAARRLRAAAPTDTYRSYLDERPGQLDSTAFFIDAAELLFERGQAELALRVLSNLAEMNLENRAVLRVLANRLVQAGQAALAVPVFRRVLALAPHEPQSHRDLGLALAADGQHQAAVDALHEVVVRPWQRFPEIELIALAELNAIAATQKVDTTRIDPRLVRNLPLDLRAVMTWDSDNTDIDLWVTDPNGEAAYYGNPLSYQGGRMSQDATGGYGPEEYALRFAKPGTYKVEAQFFGHRQQVVSNTTTIQLALSLRFGTREQSDRRVTLRLRDPKERVFVGEFEVGARKPQLVGSR